MARLTWDARQYESGLDRAVFYPQTGQAEAWSGLVSVEETLNDIRERVRYRDGQKTLNIRKEDSFSASVQMFACPDSLLKSRSPFGLSYRTSTVSGYKIHLIYNVLAITKSRTYTQQEPTPFSFGIATAPIPIPEADPTAHLIVDTSIAYAQTVKMVEDLIYGNDNESARLPTIEEILDIFDATSIVRVTDNLDGTFVVEGPDDVVTMVDDMTFKIDWASVVFIDENTYKIRNL